MQCKHCGLYISSEYSPKKVYCSKYCGDLHRGKLGDRVIISKKTVVNPCPRRKKLDYTHKETTRTVEEIMKDIIEENEKLVPDPNRIKELFEEKRLAKILRASL